MKNFRFVRCFFLAAIIFGLNNFAFSQGEEGSYEEDRIIITLLNTDLAPNEEGEVADERMISIYESFSIQSFQQAYPTSVTPRLLTRFEMRCLDCDVNALKIALEGEFPDEIEDVGLIPVLMQMKTSPPSSDYVFDVLEQFEKLSSDDCGNPFYPDDYPAGSPNARRDLNSAKVPCAWSVTRASDDIRVAVLDYPFNPNHAELRITYQHPSIQIVPNQNSGAHGVRSCGAVSTIHDNGWIANTGGNDSQDGLDGGVGLMLYPAAFKYILEAAQNGADIITCSWGYCTNDPFVTPSMLNDWQDLVDEATNDYGAIVVAAAGNAGENGGKPTPHRSYCGGTMEIVPAALNNVISVSGGHHSSSDYLLFSTSPNDPVNGHHNFHPTVDICAPGFGIMTTCNNPSGFACGDWLNNGNPIGQYWGTSAASPFTAGVISLLLTANPCLTHDDIDVILKNTAELMPDFFDLPWEGQLGGGFIDAYAAVLSAEAHYIANTSPSAAIVYSGLSICETGSVTLCADKDYSTYKWMTGPAVVGNTKCITVTEPGDYDLFFTNAKGCLQSKSIQVTEGNCCYDPCAYAYQTVLFEMHDFIETENADFTSNYNTGMYLSKTAKWNWPGEDAIAFVNDISPYNIGDWKGSDHTDGNTTFIIGDASTIADTKAFYIEENIKPGKAYYFSAWVKNIFPQNNPGEQPTLELRVERPNGQVITLANSGPLSTHDGWVQICGTYTATVYESVEFQVVSLMADQLFGFDFAIDDIILREVELFNDITICEGDCVTFGATSDPAMYSMLYFRNSTTGGAWQFDLNFTVPNSICPGPTEDTEYHLWSSNNDNFCTNVDYFTVFVLDPGSPDCVSQWITSQSPDNVQTNTDQDFKEESPRFTVVYPNPVSVGQSVNLNIEAFQEESYEVALMDIYGKKHQAASLVLYEGMNYQNITIPQSLASGVYLIVLKNEKGTFHGSKITVF